MAEESLENLRFQARVEAREAFGVVDFAEGDEDGVLGGEEVEEFFEGVHEFAAGGGGVESRLVEGFWEGGVGFLWD